MIQTIVIITTLIVLVAVLSRFLTVKKHKKNSNTLQEVHSTVEYQPQTDSYATNKNKVETRERSQPVTETTPQNNQTVSAGDPNSDFVTSFAVAYATDSALLGTVVGGDPIGAMIGDLVNQSDDSSNDSSWDSSDSTSNDSSWDSSDSTSNDSSWDSSDSSSSSFD